MTALQSTFLKISAVLWVIWGCVHAFAGVMIISGDASTGFQSIADAVEPASLEMNYPAAVGAVLNQHAWNLLWGGLATIVGAVFIWRRNMTAIWVTAMIGGLLDVGYFIFIDLGGFNQFMPGTVMTIFSGAAILLSGSVWLRRQQSSQ